MSIGWLIFDIFLFGGFGAAGDWIHKTVADRRAHKLRMLEASERKLLALQAANRPPEPVCGCTHHLAKHGADGCHEDVRTAVAWDGKRKPTAYEARRCTCQQYVGPEPLGHVYAPEISS